ncbi:MAG: hypothetical protein WBX00_24445 [Isosphaeraceae bacterium]
MSDKCAEAMQLIQVNGDILERKFFSDEDFARSFDLYPLVWKRRVLPFREPDNIDLANTPQREFGEKHYTTIVRCWMAYTANKEIGSQCEAAFVTPSVENQLKLHRLLFEFYCSMGAAIDNMEGCFNSPPISSSKAFTTIRDRPTYEGSLKWLYDRRTQFVHKALVPCFYAGELLHLNAGIFESKEVRWTDQRPGKNTEISELCNLHWSIFAGEMKKCWSTLLTLFPKMFSDVEPCLLPGTFMTLTSACSGTPPDWSPSASGYNWMRATKEQPKDKVFETDFF